MNSPPRRLPRAARPPAQSAHRAARTPRSVTRQLTGAFVLFAVLSGASAVRSADEVTVSGPIVELPKFEVTDSRLLPPPEKWLYAEIPGFEILSNLSKSATQRFVKDFLLLQEAMNVIMPGLRAGPVAVPTSLILTGRGNAFEQFMPADRGGDRYRTNTHFFRDDERGAIVVDFQIAELLLEDSTTLESDPYRGFYREYFRFIIRRNVGQKPPAWFEEGLVQLFASIEFQKKWVNFAMVGDGFGGERTGDFNRILNRRGLLSMADLLADPPRKTGTFWNAQAYAFVHMCLYGRNQKYQRPFLQFVTRLGSEPLSEELFKECFKMDYKKMALELRGYVGFTDYKYMQFAAKKGQALPEPAPFVLREAPDAVVGRVKGEVFRLGGHGNEAHNALIAPYIRGERDPRLLAALGLDEKLAGNDERARKFLEAASAAKVDRARAYLELARLRLAAAKARPGAANGRLDENQVASVLTPLFTARTTPPPMAEVYTLIAETWSLSAAAPQQEHFDVVLEGVRTFPRDTTLVMAATLLAAKRGFPQRAGELARLGARVAAQPGEKDRFQMIAAAYELDPTGAALEPPVSSATEPAAPQRTEPYLIPVP
jgi:hypothetical protein